MAKINTRYVCSACGGDSPQWQGQCPACGDWNTLTALRGVTADTVPAQSRVARRTGAIALQGLASPSSAGPPRLASGFAELDRVLGGGWVPGGVALIGGDPGIGKSTLLLQVAAQVASQAPVWYVSGEESVEQLRLRARRLGLLRQRPLER